MVKIIIKCLWKLRIIRRLWYLKTTHYLIRLKDSTLKIILREKEINQQTIDNFIKLKI